MSYYDDAVYDAKEFVREYEDEIVEQIINHGEASTDLLNDYYNADAYHRETHVDKSYSLSDADTLLHDLRDYEESDSGLWEGLEPREAISAQAAYTYGNAVYHKTVELIEEINDKASDIETDESAEDETAADVEDSYEARVRELVCDVYDQR